MLLIDKDVVVARIEEEIKVYSKAKKEYPTCEEYYEGALDILKDFRDNFLSTLEVKEVDLEEEIDKELENTWYGEYLNIDKFKESAKHFFELGLKTKDE